MSAGLVWGRDYRIAAMAQRAERLQRGRERARERRAAESTEDREARLRRERERTPVHLRSNVHVAEIVSIDFASMMPQFTFNLCWLTQVEEMLIAAVMPIVSIYRLPLGQYG